MTFYKVQIFPFSLDEARVIRTYLTAFLKDKTCEIESINPDAVPM